MTSSGLLRLGTVAAAGIFLGCVSFLRWPPYDDFAVVQVSLWGMNFAALVVGVLVALVMEGERYLPLALVAPGLISMIVPLVFILSVYVIHDMTGILDVVLVGFLQRAMVWTFSNLLFISAGSVLTMLVRSRY